MRVSVARQAFVLVVLAGCSRSTPPAEHHDRPHVSETRNASPEASTLSGDKARAVAIAARCVRTHGWKGAAGGEILFDRVRWVNLRGDGADVSFDERQRPGYSQDPDGIELRVDLTKERCERIPGE